MINEPYIELPIYKTQVWMADLTAFIQNYTWQYIFGEKSLLSGCPVFITELKKKQL